MAEFHFDIDQIANNAITKTDKTTDIITKLPTNTTGQISFYEKLSPEQQQAITAKAPALVDTFMEDQNALLDFGQAAVEGVNATVNHILAEQKKLQIPQVDELLKNTNRELNGFIAKYKEATAAELEKSQRFCKSYSNKARTRFRNFTLILRPLSKKWTAWQQLLSSKKTRLLVILWLQNS